MADLVINDLLGRFAEIIDDGADVQVIPCSALVADATLKDGNATPDITAFFAVGGNTEQVTSWTRKDIANGSITVTIDDSSDLVKIILPDQTWTGPTGGNNTTDILLAEDTNTDGTDRVVTVHDFIVTADGNDVTADFHATNGVWQSS